MEGLTSNLEMASETVRSGPSTVDRPGDLARSLTAATLTGPGSLAGLARELTRLVYSSTEQPHGVEQRLLACALRSQTLRLDSSARLLGDEPHRHGRSGRQRRRCARELRGLAQVAHAGGLLDSGSLEAVHARLAALEE
jgi:hypothetical protein